MNRDTAGVILTMTADGLPSCVPLETGWVTCGGGGTDGPMTSGQYATQQQQWRPQADVDTAVRGRT